MEVRPALKDQLLNRLELRLGDTMDSEFDRKVAANVPTGVPGRGQTPEKLHFMAALPRIDGLSSDTDLAEATASPRRRASRRHWQAPRRPRCGCCRASCRPSQLPKGDRVPGAAASPSASTRTTSSRCSSTSSTDPFFVVFGESESGKSNLLRLLIKQITERYTPETRQARRRRQPARAAGCDAADRTWLEYVADVATPWITTWTRSPT